MYERSDSIVYIEQVYHGLVDIQPSFRVAAIVNCT